MKRLWIILACTSATAWGQQRPLAVEEAVQLALENNKSLHASWMKVEAADARWSEVNASQLPSLKLQGAYMRLSEVDPFAVQVPFSPNPVTISPIVLNNYSIRLSLQQPLFTGFRLTNSASAAEYTSEAAQHEYTKDRAELIYSTKAAYWNFFKALEFKRVVSENVEQVRAHLNDVRNAMRHGLATRSDVLKVDVQLSNSRLQEIDAANAVRIAMMALNNIIGLPLETQLQLASEPPEGLEAAPSSSDSPPLQELVRQALAKRPELKAMDAHTRAGEANVRAARGGWYPQIHLVSSYYYARPNPRILPTKDEFRDTWDVGVSFSFDVWNWMTTTHQTTQAEAALVQTQDGYAQLKDAVTMEVTQNFLEIIKAREKFTVARQGVEQAEENYRITRSKFSAGVATNTDLLDSEVTLLQAKTNTIVARVDHELARARLAKSVGGED